MDVREELKEAAAKFSRSVQAVGEPPVDEDDDDVGELEVSEYIILMFAFDTFIRYVEETMGIEDPGPDDSSIPTKYRAVMGRGMKLMRMVERELADIRDFLDKSLPGLGHKRMLSKAMRIRATSAGAVCLRSFQLNRVLSRGGTPTLRAVFQTNIRMAQIREAITAVDLKDGDAALDLFAGFVIKNPRIRAWIDLAAKVAGSEPEEAVPGETGEGTVVPPPVEVEPSVRAAQDPIDQAVKETADHGTALLTQTVDAMAAAGSEEAEQATARRQETIQQIGQEATEAARKALGEEGDAPLTHSETVGVAVAAATAAVSDPAKPTNIPASLSSIANDPEQLAAALTDGRVLVTAGAGSGKTRTLVARIKYLLNERGVLPTRIMATSFNRKAGRELKGKVGELAGPETAKMMTIGTMNSLFSRGVRKYGNAEERTMMGKGFVGGGGAIASQVQRLWPMCFPKSRIPKKKDALVTMSSWRGNGVSPEQAMATAMTPKKKDLAKWYEMYQGFKGALGPDWKPDCEDRISADKDALFEKDMEAYRRGRRRQPPKRSWTDKKNKRTVHTAKYQTVFQAFMANKRPGGIKLGDYDDQISSFKDILSRNPAVRQAYQQDYDHILVDECIHEDTEVVTRDGSKRVADVCPGDELLSYENGSATFKRVLDKKQSRKSTGIVVRTETGQELAMTTNHRLYASSFESVPEGQLALYVMYRQDKGFRIGASTRPVQRVGRNGPRPNAERADALWILEVGEPSEILFKEQALSLRHRVPTYVFEGEVRGCDQERIDRVFAEFGKNGQDLLDLYDLNFHYPHWTNTTYTGANQKRRVLAVRAHRGGPSAGTTVNMSWTGEDAKLDDFPVYNVRGGRKMLNKRLADYVEAREFAVKVANKCDGRVVETLPINGQPHTLTTAGALMPGMTLPVWLGGWVADGRASLLRSPKVRAVADKYGVAFPVRGSISSITYDEIRRRQQAADDPEVLPELDATRMGVDRIVDIQPVDEGTFYDLTIEGTANFFANGVLSHNCQDLNQVQHDVIEMMAEHITDGSDGKSLWMVGDVNQSIYGFRGARPDKFTEKYEDPGWKPRGIMTNYRSEPEIVEHANSLIAYNPQLIPMEAKPAPGRPRGRAEIEVKTPRDDVAGAMGTIEAIKADIERRPADEMAGAAGEYAILARTNKELNAYETASILRGVPYARKGSGSFLGSPETTTVQSYLSLAVGGEPEVLQKAFGNALNNPGRFFIKGMNREAMAESVKKGFTDYAKYLGVPRNQVDPNVAITDHEFQKTLLKALYGSGFSSQPDWKVDKDVTKLDELGEAMQELSEVAQERTTKDLFDTILAIQTEQRVFDKEKGEEVYKYISLRESIETDLRDQTDPEGDDEENDVDDETDEYAGLGNIAYLYELIKVDPTDPEDAVLDPNTPAGFKAKMGRYAGKARKLRLDIDEWYEKNLKPPPEHVYLGTAHSTKGGQWKNVTVQMPGGRFPMEPFVEPGEPPPPPEEIQAQLEDERRLAYVAITRPITNLTIMCPAKLQGMGGAGGVSQFVKEAGFTLPSDAGADAGVEPEPAVKEATWEPGPDDIAPWDEADFGGEV